MTFKFRTPPLLPRIPQYDPAAGSESTSDPDYPPLRNPHPLSGSEDISPAHASHSLFGWPGDRPGRLAKLPARAPFDRLKFWTVHHELTYRLLPYKASATPSVFRSASWGTLLRWSMLLDGIEIEEPVKV